MNIKNIVFDFGGVLLDWNPRYLYNKLFDNKQEVEYFLTNVCSESWNIEQDAGRPLAEATKLLQNQFPEYELMIKRYYNEWEVMLKGEIHQNTVLIPSLKKKYRLFGLTNWSGETFPIALKKHGFLHEFEGIVVSGDEKLIKPDKKIYQLLLDRYKLKPEDSLFIDDNINNIKTADELGFHTVHLTHNLNLKHRIRTLGIL